MIRILQLRVHFKRCPFFFVDVVKSCHGLIAGKNVNSLTNANSFLMKKQTPARHYKRPQNAVLNESESATDAVVKLHALLLIPPNQEQPVSNGNRTVTAPLAHHPGHEGPFFGHVIKRFGRIERHSVAIPAACDGNLALKNRASRVAPALVHERRRFPLKLRLGEVADVDVVVSGLLKVRSDQVELHRFVPSENASIEVTAISPSPGSVPPST